MGSLKIIIELLLKKNSIWYIVSSTFQAQEILSYSLYLFILLLNIQNNAPLEDIELEIYFANYNMYICTHFYEYYLYMANKLKFKN